MNEWRNIWIGQDQQAEALELLIGRGENNAAKAVSRFMSHAQGHGINLNHLWGAVDEADKLQAVVLIVPRPGGTGLVYLSPPARRGVCEAVGRLVDFAAEQMVDDDVNDEVVLLQSLLNRDEDMEKQAYLAGGFHVLATLDYMQKTIGRSEPAAVLPENMRFEMWCEGLNDTFLEILEASYEQTLDCPGLCGLRDTSQVLEGHKAAGLFHAELWQLLYVDEKPVGVILVNEIPGQRGAELVYLGLTLRGRGMGSGKLMMQQGLYLCRQRNFDVMYTAVDHDNTPAQNLYHSLGFKRTVCKVAMVRTLKKS